LLAYDWDFSVAWASLPLLLQGLGVTIAVTLLVMALSLPLSLIVALARLSPARVVSGVAYCYTEFFRTTPVLVQITWFYFALPLYSPIKFGAFAAGVIALTLNVTAFLAEVFRGAIVSVSRGQWDAALSTGMTTAQAYRRVVIPQAARRAIPIVATIYTGLFKDTSLVAAIGVQDLMYQAQGAALATYRPLEILTLAAVLYVLLTYPQSVVAELLYRRLRVEE
jgi:polar amino acid transport system permease protein